MNTDKKPLMALASDEDEMHEVSFELEEAPLKRLDLDDLDDRDDDNNNNDDDDVHAHWRSKVDDFSKGLKSEQELEQLPAATRLFYKHQNELIERYLKMAGDGFRVVDSSEDDGGAGEQREWLIKMAIWSSFGSNVLLLLLKLVAFLFSHSLAILGSFLDSCLDLLSGAIIFFTHWLINRTKHSHQYPAGNGRIEPLGLIVFSAVMFTATLQLFLTSVGSLVDRGDPVVQDWVVYAIVAFTITLKSLLFVGCAFVHRRTGNETVQALMQDHRNDVLTNSFGMAFALLSKYWWPLDPIAAIVLCLFIMWTWGNTCLDQVRMLSGIGAPSDLLNTVTFLARNHHPQVVAVDTVRGWHLSYDFIVEVDIVLPEDMPLKQAHDIGESLQLQIEKLDRVERAFVHLDFEFEHKPEH